MIRHEIGFTLLDICTQLRLRHRPHEQFNAPVQNKKNPMRRLVGFAFERLSRAKEEFPIKLFHVWASQARNYLIFSPSFQIIKKKNFPPVFSFGERYEMNGWYMISWILP